MVGKDFLSVSYAIFLANAMFDADRVRLDQILSLSRNPLDATEPSSSVNINTSLKWNSSMANNQTGQALNAIPV